MKKEHQRKVIEDKEEELAASTRREQLLKQKIQAFED